jgi:cysteate synthase
MLRCPGCNGTRVDDGLSLVCPVAHGPALLAVEYDERRFQPDSARADLFRYRRWLPVRRLMAGAGCAVTYRSESLARVAGVGELWVAFNGWWPERGASLATATFKELEAWTVLARLPEAAGSTLVLASAGNTAAAFARACTLAEQQCVIVLPDSGLPHLAACGEIAPWVKLVVLSPPADYSDAITLAGALAELDGFVAEGGVRNVARRAGLGTVLLSAVEAIGRLPDYYVQAVGSGAGAIGVVEAATRLAADGRYGERLPRLLLSQNRPFTPMVDAWQASDATLRPEDPDDARVRVAQLLAPVLSNREPPYALRGGVRDALLCSGGDMVAVDNRSAEAAAVLFETTEGIDIDPAGAVALASLLQAVPAGRMRSDSTVLLNVTGGGRRRRVRENGVAAAQPVLRLNGEMERVRAVEQVAAL